MFGLFRLFLRRIMFNTGVFDLRCCHGDRDAAAFKNRNEQHQVVLVPQQHRNKNKTAAAIFLISSSLEKTRGVYPNTQFLLRENILVSVSGTAYIAAHGTGKVRGRKSNL